MYVAAVCTDTVYTKGYIIMVSYLSSSPAVIGDPLEIDVINVKKAQFSGNFLIVLSDDYTTGVHTVTAYLVDFAVPSPGPFLSYADSVSGYDYQ